MKTCQNKKFQTEDLKCTEKKIPVKYTDIFFPLLVNKDILYINTNFERISH